MDVHVPIIKSLLDLDLYKLTMGQMQWRTMRNEPARFRLNNRTKSVDLLDFLTLDDVRAECDAVRALRVTEQERRYLASLGFDAEYLDWLGGLQLPEIEIGADGQRLTIEASGLWPEITYWETLVLSIVNELFCRGVVARDGLNYQELYATGRERLQGKIARLRENPEIRIIEFGTRRRFSAQWQDEVIATLVREVPDQLSGTSNVYAAFCRGLTPIGTYAHEMPMGYTAHYNDLETGVTRGHRQMMEDWFEEFGVERSVALTDTFGSEFFFRDFAPMAAAWAGVRHDSGDPFEFGERVIRYYNHQGIDPATKLIVFSDGLDIDVITRLQAQFQGRVKLSYGWGTNLTNDLGIRTLSLVMKIVETSGRGTIKLSDNVNKAMGDTADVAKAIKLFTYTNTQAQELIT